MRDGWLVVLGTGTEIGKTEVSASLVRGGRAAGRQVAGLKPVLTGADKPDDADRLGEAAGLTVRPIFQFEPPVSPHLAARSAGTQISLTEIAEWVAEHCREVTIVETAGGMLSPLSDRSTNLDLALALQPVATVLVTSARLGVLHNVAAAVLAARHLAPQLSWSAIVVSSPEVGFEVAVRELRDVVLPRVGCAAPVIGFGPVGSRTRADDLALFRACLPGFT